jgi:hypothetical protein
MKTRLHSGVTRARQATACAVIVACLAPLPASVRAESADHGGVALPAGVLSKPVEPAGLAWSTRGCDASAGGFLTGHPAAQWWNDPPATPIRESLANLSSQQITLADRKISAESQRIYRGRPGRRRSGDRAMWGLFLGAIGGLIVGGIAGAEISAGSCHCDNPELHGFVIGAPIGTVVGAFMGYAVASR